MDSPRHSVASRFMSSRPTAPTTQNPAARSKRPVTMGSVPTRSRAASALRYRSRPSLPAIPASGAGRGRRSTSTRRWYALSRPEVLAPRSAHAGSAVDADGVAKGAPRDLDLGRTLQRNGDRRPGGQPGVGLDRVLFRQRAAAEEHRGLPPGLGPGGGRPPEREREAREGQATQAPEIPRRIDTLSHRRPILAHPERGSRNTRQQAVSRFDPSHSVKFDLGRIRYLEGGPTALVPPDAGRPAARRRGIAHGFGRKLGNEVGCGSPLSGVTLDRTSESRACRAPGVWRCLLAVVARALGQGPGSL
jgi:hypothetical protein